MEEHKRAVVVIGLHARWTIAAIAEFKNLRWSLCFRIKNEFDNKIDAWEDSGDIFVDQKIHKRWSNLINIPEFVQQLQDVTNEGPGGTRRYVNGELNVDKKTIQKLCQQRSPVQILCSQKGTIFEWSYHEEERKQGSQVVL